MADLKLGWRPGEEILVDLPDEQVARCRIDITEDGIASRDGTVRVWDLSTGTPVGDPLTGHTSAVEAVAALGAARRALDRGHRQLGRHGAGVGLDHRRPAR